MTCKIHTICRGVAESSTDGDLGVLTIYYKPIFSVGTRDLICADFRTSEGCSQVCTQIRGRGFYVRGAHGDTTKRGITHPTIEAAVADAAGEAVP